MDKHQHSKHVSRAYSTALTESRAFDHILFEQSRRYILISILQLINDRTKGSNPGLLKIYLGHVTHALLSVV